MPVSTRKPAAREVELARVLVVNDDLTSRLTLKTVLEAGGYSVDAVASEAEALGKLDQFQYELVLSDSDMDAPQAAQKVLAHARLMEYEPATACLPPIETGSTMLTGRFLSNPRSCLIFSAKLPT